MTHKANGFSRMRSQIQLLPSNEFPDPQHRGGVLVGFGIGLRKSPRALHGVAGRQIVFRPASLVRDVPQSGSNPVDCGPAES